MKVETIKGEGFSNKEIQSRRQKGMSTEQIRAELSKKTFGDKAITSSPSKGSSPATTRRAANDPHKKDIFGVTAEAVFDGTSSAFETLGKAGSSLQNVTRKAATYSKAYKLITESSIQSIGVGAVGISAGIENFGDSITRSMDRFSDQIRLNTEPISDFMGQTLGTLTGIIEDPLGPNGLGNAATRLINSVSPGMGDKINGLNKSLHLEAIGRLPEQIMSSVSHIMQAVNDLLAIPLSILSEIYYGLMAIMKSITKMINGIIDGFMQLLLNFLDSIIPIKSILSLLDSISTLANQIGGLAGGFGLNIVTDITSQITGFTDQFTSILSNPLDFATSFLPPQVSSVLGSLQNPETLLSQFLPGEIDGLINGLQNPTDLIKQFLPPQLAQGFDKLSSMTGLGYMGNMGYGTKESMKEVQGNVLKNLTTQHEKQIPILAPLLAGQPEIGEANQPKLLGEGDVKVNNHLYPEGTRTKSPQYQKAQVA